MSTSDIRPSIADGLGPSLEAEGQRIALGLVDVRRDILVPAFCFNDSDTLGSDVKRVVGRSALRGPFSNSKVPSFCR